MGMCTIVNEVAESMGEYNLELALETQCNSAVYIGELPFPLVFSQFDILLVTCLETYKANVLPTFRYFFPPGMHWTEKLHSIFTKAGLVFCGVNTALLPCKR